jgi:hypothetical protein
MKTATDYINENMPKIKQSKGFYQDQADALYLWVINTQDCYKAIMDVRSQYLAGKLNIKEFVMACLLQCLDQRIPLQNAEEDMSRITLASTKATALQVANYYLNIYIRIKTP